MKDELGDRIKNNYEIRSRNYLTRRTPVIVRVDGKCFSSFCKRFERPYDEFLNNSLNNVMQYVCENVQGVKLAERHSDELSFLLTDYETIKTSAYFDYSVQKMCSVVAAMVTSEFCRQLVLEDESNRIQSTLAGWPPKEPYLDINEPWPTFDARCFNIPQHEVSNYFLWRMQDAKRNSINMWAQSFFSHKALQGVSNDEKQEMMFAEHGLNWGTLPQGKKVGFMCIKRERPSEITKGPKVVIRKYWDVFGSPENRTKLCDIVEPILENKEPKVSDDDRYAIFCHNDNDGELEQLSIWLSLPQAEHFIKGKYNEAKTGKVILKRIES